MNGWDAFLVGISRAWRYRQLVLVVFAINLAVALATACPAALNLVGPARRPAIREATDGLDAWAVVEAFVRPNVGGGLAREGVGAASAGVLQRIGLVGVATIGILLVLAWLSKALLSGGVLSTYSENDGFRWGRFLRGCRRWFGTLLLLAPLEVVVTAVVLLPLLILAAAGFVAVPGGAGWLVVALFGGAASLWWATMEMAYIVVVTDGRRNVFKVLRRAVGFVLGHLPAVGALYGSTILIGVLLITLYRWGLRPRMPASAWLSLFLVQQVFIVMRLFVRLARLAGGVELYRVRSGPEAA